MEIARLIHFRSMTKIGLVTGTNDPLSPLIPDVTVNMRANNVRTWGMELSPLR
jgi:hypothetical protein